MNLLDRYPTRKCILGILLVIAVLSGLTLSFALIDELNKDHENYGFTEAMIFVTDHAPADRRVNALRYLYRSAVSSSATWPRAAS